MRIPLSTPLKTRTGVPEGKDARLLNSYVEVKGDQSVVRKRPIAQGGVSVGTGTAQGGIGLNIGGTDYVYTFNGDTGALDTLASAGTNWAVGTSYSIGDHVSYGFVDYWAVTDHTGSTPPSADWSTSYIAAVPFAGTYATWSPPGDTITLSNGNLTTSNDSGVTGFVYANMQKTTGKWYFEITKDSATSVTASVRILVEPNGAGRYFSTGIQYIDQVSPPLQYFRKIIDGVDTNLAFSVPVSGSVMSVYFDCDNGLIYCLVDGINPMGDGVPIHDYGTQTTFKPLIFVDGDTLTANFGASAFTYPVPSGYNRGLYTIP